MPRMIIVGILIVVFTLIKNDLIHTAQLFSDLFSFFRALNQKLIEKTFVEDRAILHIKDHTSISSSNSTMVVNLTVAVMVVEAEEVTTTTKALIGIISSNSNTIHE